MALLRSALEVLEIAEVERRRDELSERCLSPEERAEVAGRRVQSTAGVLAAKRALVRLFGELGGPPSVAERDFVLARQPSGAPRVVSAPPAPSPGLTLRVSISHTCRFAYGLAVAVEPFEPPEIDRG